MKLLHIVTAGLVTIASASVLADSHAVTGLLDSNKDMAGSKVSCLTVIGAEGAGHSSVFRNNLLSSATGGKSLAVSTCAVNGLSYNAGISSNVFSGRQARPGQFSQVARASLINDADLLQEKTVLQASVTGSVAQFARFTLVDDIHAATESRTPLQARVTRR